ncbi:Pyridoxine 5'-phosphate oxidase [Serinicoccus hydrothermalis]|uniref:Pyridoxine 5'-phosphate oxidase n=1 Tax=Serinicoccus hydrothermalis TaxID=1758689 RepID=A0A1B1NDB3_9MICO|nr:PPOX class F420-dependent oxidoreductase [Serinicoccus hydrothermalis]ANS79422.1 Pyridoxine 5'-phosphate oxidase [Serinicoccus hydrothermalis]
MDPALREILTSGGTGALTSIKRDGQPQLSMVTYAIDPEATLVRVSTTDGRAKVANLRRDPRSSLFVTSSSGWSYAVAQGTVELSPVAAAPDDPTVESLVQLYRDANGEHPDWDDYRRAMVADRRLVVRLSVDHVYGVAQG